MGLLKRASASKKIGIDISDSVENKIAYFYEAHNVLNCIVLETRVGSKYSKNLQDIIGKIGTVVTLSSGNSLIMFRAAVDRDLIAHRLSKSLNIPSLQSFEASSPEFLKQIIGNI